MATSTDIRTDAIAKLGQAFPGVPIADSLSDPYADTDPAPALWVFTPRGQYEPAGLSGDFDLRETLAVGALAEGATDAALAASVDTLEAQVLATFLESVEWRNRWQVNRVTAERGRDSKSAKRRGWVVVQIEVEARAGWVPAGTDPLTLVTVDTDRAPADGALEVQAHIELEGAE